MDAQQVYTVTSKADLEKIASALLKKDGSMIYVQPLTRKECDYIFDLIDTKLLSENKVGKLVFWIGDMAHTAELTVSALNYANNMSSVRIIRRTVVASVDRKHTAKRKVSFKLAE